MIQSLINERQTTRQNAIEEITSKWVESKPFRAVFRHSLYETLIKDDLQTVVEQNLVLLPETLDVSAMLLWKAANAALYDASVYGSICSQTDHSICRLWRNRESAFRK
jgi:inner membrane protein involved in colicin E2 resistance